MNILKIKNHDGNKLFFVRIETLNYIKISEDKDTHLFGFDFCFQDESSINVPCNYESINDADSELTHLLAGAVNG